MANVQHTVENPASLPQSTLSLELWVSEWGCLIELSAYGWKCSHLCCLL